MGRGALGPDAGIAPDVAVALAVVGADGRRQAGAPDHAPELLAAACQALELDDDHLRRRAVLAALRLGACCQPGADQVQAVALADRAIALELDPDGRALLHASASLTHSMVDADASRQHFEQALDLAGGLGGTDETLVEVLPYAYLSLGRPGDLPKRRAVAQRLADAAHARSDPIALFEAGHLRFSVALQLGDASTLHGAHAEMEALSSRVGDVGRRWALAYQRTTLLQLAGELDAAEVAAREAFEVGTGVAAARATAAWTAQMLEIRRLQGRLDELGPMVEQLLTDPNGLPAWRAAALVMVSTDRRAARPVVDKLVEGLATFPRDFSYGAAMLTLARAVVALEAAEQAPALLAVLLPWAHLFSWQGTTTYGPYGEAAAALATLVGDDASAVTAQEATRAVTSSLGSDGYAVSSVEG